MAWDTAAAVKPLGSLVYLAQYLSTGGLLDGLMADCPLEYKSGNVPGKRSVIGTTLLAIILSVAFRVWLRGKGLHPVVEGNQTLLLLTT